MSMKNSNDLIGNRTRNLLACSAVPRQIAPPHPQVAFWGNINGEKWMLKSQVRFFVISGLLLTGLVRLGRAHSNVNKEADTRLRRAIHQTRLAALVPLHCNFFAVNLYQNIKLFFSQ
jgi:hypothetical protein